MEENVSGYFFLNTV